MKKVVGILMLVVMMYVVNAIASESVVTGETGSTVAGWVYEWCESNDYKRNTYDIVHHGCYFGFGVIDEADMIEEYGCEFSIENVCNLYRSDLCEFDVEDVNVEIVGTYENYNVYKLHIKTNNSLGEEYTEDGEFVDYYEGELIFMVCDGLSD